MQLSRYFVLTITMLFLASSLILAQTPDEIFDREAVVPENKNESNPDVDSLYSPLDDTSIRVDEPELLAQNNNTNNTNQNRSLNGFAETAWKSSFSEVKTRLQSLSTSDTSTEKVVIVALKLNDYILVKRNDIMYRYNFYKTPYEVALLQNHQLTKETHDQKEALLFHVKVITPFIDSFQIKEKISNLHGPNTKTTFDEKKKNGADIWELGNGLIFQWYEPYHEKPFTRSVDYLSSQMAAEIMKEYESYFDAKERLLLQKIILK